MVSSEIIYDRLREIEENVSLLEEFLSLSFNAFAGDPKIYKLAERCLELSIQCILDISHHLIVENNWSRPRSNQEAIITLGEKKVLPVSFAKKISPLAGLRNLLVHEYIKIDTALMFRQLQKLDDFRVFEKHIMNFIRET